MSITEAYSVTSPLNVSFFFLLYPFTVGLFFSFFFIYLWLLGIHCCVGFSLVVQSGGSSLVAAHRLLSVWSMGSRGRGFQ